MNDAMNPSPPRSVVPHCTLIVLATAGAIFELVRTAACYLFSPLDVYDTGPCAAPLAALIAAFCGYLGVTTTMIFLDRWGRPLSFMSAALFLAGCVTSRGDAAMIVGFLIGAATVALVLCLN